MNRDFKELMASSLVPSIDITESVVSSTGITAPENVSGKEYVFMLVK